MTTKIDLFKNFQPVEEAEFNGLLKTINNRYGQLMETVSLACMNAAYYSIIAGRAEFANRLLETCPKYLKAGVQDYLTKVGRLAIQGTGRKAMLAIADKDQVKVGDKVINTPKQQDGKDAAVEYLKTIGRPSFQRNPAKRKPTVSMNWYDEISGFMDRMANRKKQLDDNRNAGQEVKEEHEELLEIMRHTFQQYQRDKMGIGAVEAAGEEEEQDVSVLQQQLEEARKELEAAKSLLAKRKTVKGERSEEGRQGLKAA